MTMHRVVMRATLSGPGGAPVAHEAVNPSTAVMVTGDTWIPTP